MSLGITLIILGILAAPSLLLSKKPNAKELLDKIVPYQGWIGFAYALWGLWNIILCFLHLSLLGLGVWGIIAWVLALATSIIMTALGFLLGYGLLQKLLLSKNEAAKEKGEQLLAKLAPIQGKLGLTSIILGVVYIVVIIVF